MSNTTGKVNVICSLCGTIFLRYPSQIREKNYCCTPHYETAKLQGTLSNNKNASVMYMTNNGGYDAGISYTNSTRMVSTAFTADADTLEKLDKIAATKGTNRSETIRQIIKEYGEE